ncbi:MAG: phosphoesterase, PA-phosphatase related [uncultured Solirubrobacteraceae bacterium]|uniref:Phosphoesterase, PA-phosphatase related n=1 Tax=uncultured Solirubrobacteraceae bacterium TaxID=1162706 RepID=A0A6J4RIP1_9ACTN|nr:MAG: phosphoesterase, PA-phosphatase related [uncultured Solirubrobacteraceae bacterium]
MPAGRRRTYTRAAVRPSSVARAGATVLLAAGVCAPLARRRARLRAPVVLGLASAAPVCLRVLAPASRARDAGVVLLQMWAYLAAYEMPNDDPAALERRVRVAYPVRVDRVLGLGVTPTVRLQRRFGRPGPLSGVEKVLVWSHWLWFAFPHGTAAYVLLRNRESFPRAAALIYGTFDVGVLGYWALPTAPPWYAAQRGHFTVAGGGLPRRIMVEYGADFWKSRWERMYGSLAGNPLAAMPSLHFATSVTAAHVLSEQGRVPQAIGWAYAGTLGVALVYLGEHYVVDLLAGLALAEGVRAAAPAAARRLAPLLAGLRAAEEAMRR